MELPPAFGVLYFVFTDVCSKDQNAIILRTKRYGY